VTILLLLAAVVLTILLPAVWICRVNRKVHEDYAKRWGRLNEKVGGVLPPYEEAKKRSDQNRKV
jgi:hypothetical protein